MDHDNIVAICQLIARYGHAVDAADPDLLAEVFTDDIVVRTAASVLVPICLWTNIHG